MRHLLRILAVAAPVAGVAYSTALATPAVTDFITKHPADAAIVALVPGIVHALYKALRDAFASNTVPPPSGGTPTMAAK